VTNQKTENRSIDSKIDEILTTVRGLDSKANNYIRAIFGVDPDYPLTESDRYRRDISAWSITGDLEFKQSKISAKELERFLYQTFPFKNNSISFKENAANLNDDLSYQISIAVPSYDWVTKILQGIESFNGLNVENLTITQIPHRANI